MVALTLTNNGYSEKVSAFDFINNDNEESYSTSHYKINKKQDTVDTVIPFIKLIEEEVKLLPKKKQKKYFNLLRIMSLTAIPLTVAKNTNAQMIQTSTKPINISFIENKGGLGILPPDIFEILIQLIGGAMMIGSLIAILLLIVAGGFKMAGQSDKAKKWITEILKGLGIILLAPALIILLVAITSMTLSGIDGLDIFY